MVDHVILYAICTVAAFAAFLAVISFLRAVVNLIFAKKRHDTAGIGWYAAFAVIFGILFALLLGWILMRW